MKNIKNTETSGKTSHNSNKNFKYIILKRNNDLIITKLILCTVQIFIWRSSRKNWFEFYIDFSQHNLYSSNIEQNAKKKKKYTQILDNSTFSDFRNVTLYSYLLVGK